MKQNQHLVLIDGYGFLFRAFHALPPLIRADGVNVGAVYGFTSMLTKIILEHVCSHLAVVFDSGEKNFRHEIFPEYKSHRPPVPEELIPQFALVREAVTALNIDVLQKKGFEADDIIATVAKQASNQGIKVTIVSSDKDLMQLIDDNISLFDPMKYKTVREEKVFEKFGVRPDQVADVLALIGDSSDFVPGVPGIGPKTAAELINKFESLEGLYNNIDSVPPSKRKDSLITNKDLAFLSYKLVTLDDQVHLEHQLDDIRIKIAHVEQFKKFLEFNSFKSLYAKAEKICTSFLEKNGEHHDPLRTVKIIDLNNKAELKNWLDTKVHLTGHLSLIMEAGYICLASDEREVAILKYINNEGLFSSSAAGLKDCASVIIEYFNDPSVRKVMHDVKKIYHVFSEYGEIKDCAWDADDIQIISYVLNNGIHGHDLKSLIQANYILDESLDIKIWLSYCPVLIINLLNKFKSRLIQEKLVVLYQRVEKPLSHVLYKMEKAGIKVDRSRLKSISEEFNQRSLLVEKEVYHLSNEHFNLASPKQLSEVLFTKMGIKPKSSKLSTNADVLEELALEGYEIAEKILQWRSLTKLNNTYASSLANNADIHDRIHTNFQMTITSTGRLSSISPNLQNIPNKTEDGNRIRSAFITEDSSLLISADYSQIELRLLAHMADIDSLKKAFIEGRDIHAATASEVFNIPLAEVTSEIRSKAKAINFGIIYGISSFGLANQIKVSKQEAKQYIDNYFMKYPGILEYMEKTKNMARSNGYVETLLGRRCYIKSINDSNVQLRNFSERAAINAPLQGTASDIIKKAMIELDHELVKKNIKAKILLQVHDELIIEAERNVVKNVQEIARSVMQSVITLSVPLIVDTSCGSNWAEL